MEAEKNSILSWWSMIRWFMVTVLFSIGILHIKFQDNMVQSMVFFGVFLGIVALNLLFQLQVSFRKMVVIVFQIVLDLIFATLVVHLTGGPSSYFVWIYLIAVITASLTIPKFGGVIAGLAGSMFLLILMVMYQNNIISPNNSNPLDVTGSTVYILSYTGLFCGVAFLAGYLNEQLSLVKAKAAIISKLNEELEAFRAKEAEAKEQQRDLDDLFRSLREIARLDHDINTPLCVISLSISRVKKLAMELDNESLGKTGAEITESVNRISALLKKLDMLKDNKLLAYKRGELP
ncbi:MAG: histidine kinase [Candidatus Cloacimonadota bacterium]